MKNAKIMAIIAVFVMLAVCIIPMTEGGSDAASGDGGTYTYTLTYDASAMTTTSQAISVAGMNPITHGSNTSAYQALNPGSWTWNTTTGVGPFNSFYAAFDINNGNAFVDVLNPYDLSKRVNGQSLPSGNYNIMLVIPTVYWKVSGGNLTLTNNASAGGTAYAHTIDGHVYNYIAIGVYEASTDTVGNTTVLTSKTGAMPTVSQTRETFRTQAHAYTMDSSLGASSHSMLWNFYQWELYKYMCYTVMEDFNSQNHVGNGKVYSDPRVTVYQTGATDQSGPYIGNPGHITDATTGASYGQDYVKLFLENAWGGAWDIVDGAVVTGQTGIQLSQSSNPTDDVTKAQPVKTISIVNGYATAIMTSADLWGFQTATVGGSDVTGLSDYIWTNTENDRLVIVGGGSYTSPGNSVSCGLSHVDSDYALTLAAGSVGARLAFVFDASLAAKTNVGITSNNTDYGTVNVATINDVMTNQTLTISNNTLSVAGTTVTATKKTNTAQYSYMFDGWYNGNTKLNNGDPVTMGMSITAKFTRTVNVYNVHIQSNNPDWGTVDVGDVPNTPYGSTLHLSGTNGNILTITNSITQSNTVITATASDPDTYYTYGFDGYETDGQRIQDGDTIVGARTIVANFNRTNIYTVIVQPANEYGAVSLERVIGVPEGTTITTVDDELTVYNQTSKAIPLTNTAQYSYAFTGWSVPSGTPVTSNMTVEAGFSRTVNTYTVPIGVNDVNYGEVSANTIANVPYGSQITVNGNTITINGTTITATPSTATMQYTYTFVGWYDGNTPIANNDTTDENTSITARFMATVNDYTVTIQSNNTDYGTVSASSVTVPYGTSITSDGGRIVIGTTHVFAIPTTSTDDYRYTFDGWFLNNVEITEDITVQSNTTITAKFTATPTYTVTIASDNGYGTVSQSVIKRIAPGTVITVSDNVLIIGENQITATPKEDTAQYDYTFAGWSVTDGTVINENTDITASFTRDIRSYTVTWVIQGTSTTETYEYGERPTHANPSIDGYRFNGWTPSIKVVSGDATYTALLKPLEYIVKWNANGGKVDTSTTRGSIENPVEAPTPTWPYHTFDGWFTEATGGTQVTFPLIPTQNVTFYAHWTAIEYTITLDANGGEVDPVTLTGSPVEPVTLPAATIDILVFDGWYSEAVGGELVGIEGTLVYPTENVTYHARWAATASATFQVMFDMSGGYDGPSAMLAKAMGDETSYTFTIPDAEPVRDGMYFVGWKTSPSATVNYESGDRITVNADETVTLYAQWSSTPLANMNWIKVVIPVLVGIGLLMATVGLFVSGKLDIHEAPSQIIAIAVGLFVLILVLVPFVNAL